MQCIPRHRFAHCRPALAYHMNVIEFLLPPANEVWGKAIFLHLSVILFTRGIVPGQVQSQDEVPPRTRYTPQTKYTPHPHPRTRYTPWTRYNPWDQVPLRSRYTPLGPGIPPSVILFTGEEPGQVHPPVPQTRYTLPDQVHPPGPGAPAH